MTSAVAKYAAKKMMSKQLKEYKNKEPAGPYDPYYEYRTDPRTNKKKKMKKQIPAYIPAHDADVLAHVRKAAYRLDMSLFNFMGIRFGVSSVIGLVPEIGDVVDAAMALGVVRKCMKVEGGLPKSVLINMLVWVFIDFIIGLVPFVGDLLDASIKANTKNCRILEEHLDKKYKPKAETVREKELREEYRRSGVQWQEPAPATVYEDMSDDDGLPQYEEATGAGRQPTAGTGGRDHRAPAPAAQGPTQPAPTRTADERRAGVQPERSSRSFFGRGRASRPNDVEAAANAPPQRSQRA